MRAKRSRKKILDNFLTFVTQIARGIRRITATRIGGKDHVERGLDQQVHRTLIGRANCRRYEDGHNTCLVFISSETISQK